MNSPDLEEVILDLLKKRSRESSICPSEAARAAFPETWRQHMDSVRKAAVSLSRQKRIVILQNGKRVDPQNFRGPIRLKLAE